MTWLASTLTAFALTCTISIVSVPQAGCYRDGAQRDSCSQMQVEHLNSLTGALASAQPCGSCPYMLSVEAMVNSGTRMRTGGSGSIDTYQCGQDYELLLGSTSNSFEGFLVEARTAALTFSNTTEIWGTWLVEAGDPYHAINCSDSAESIATAATQNNPIGSDSDPAVTLYWRAPPVPLTTQEYDALPQRITFWFTIVQQLLTFFEPIEGPTLQRGCTMPFNCTIDPCQNGGTCDDDTDRCDCPSGFTGDACEADIDDCASSPCQNGGTCSDDGVDSFSCSCVAGFIGNTCETNVDDCAPPPCQNGGMCSDGVNSFTCTCIGGFTGVRCETAALSVSITVDYTPPPDAVLGENEYRAASSILLTCGAEGFMGNVVYAWVSTLGEGSGNQRGESILGSGDTGNHTCTVTDSSSNSGSATTQIIVVGAGIYVQEGDDSVPLGALPNNSLMISRISSSTTRLRFFCRSTSSSGFGNLIGLDGSPVTLFQFFVQTEGGVLEAVNSIDNTAIGSTNQGIYTCRVPDGNGRTVDINVGIYSNDIHSAPALQERRPSRLTSSSSSLTLGCTSLQSPPTFVTWLKDGIEVAVDGTTIREAKAIENRAASSYVNMLLINMEPDSLLGGYSCNVSNVLGSSGFSDVLTINGLQITGHEQPLIIGTKASFNCSSDLDVTAIEWLNEMGTAIINSSTDAVLVLELDPVTSDLHNQVFTCRVTSPYGTQDQSITVVIAPALSVSITVDYTPPPDAVLGENEYRAASSILLTCGAEDAMGSVGYTWVSTLGEGSGNQRGESILGSDDTGNHTCTVTDSTSNSGSATTQIIVVGAGIYVQEGDDSVPLGALSNNSLMISRDSSSSIRLRFSCRSTSASSGVGELIDLIGNPVNLLRFFVDTTQVGTVEVVNSNNNVDIGSTNQGIYTCRIPDENGRTVDINVGIYSNDIHSAPALQEPLPSRLTSSSSSLTLGCTSLQSPPTFVTWLKDGVEVAVDGTTIREAKAIENRAASSYVNMLLINMEPDSLLGGYSCNVSNVLGSSGFSDVLTINGLQIIGHEQPLIIGTTASFNCSSDLDVTAIEWLNGMGSVIVNSSTGALLVLELDPVTSDLHNQVFTCRVTSPYGTQDQSITVTVDFTPQTTLSVIAVPIHPRSFRLEWNAITFDSAPVTGYAVSVTATRGSDANVVNTIDFVITDAATSSYTFSNLSPFTYQLGAEGIEYSCTMQVLNAFGSGPSSEVASTVIPPCAGTCDFQFQVADASCSCSCSPAYTGESCDVPTFAPQNVQAAIIDSSPNDPGLNVTWEPPPTVTLDWRQITGYLVNVSGIGDMPIEVEVSMSSTQIDIPSLMKGNNYSVTVSTQTDLNDTATSALTFIFIPPDPTGEVQDLVANSNTTTIRVSWNLPGVIPANGEVLRYRVDYQDFLDISKANGTLFTPDASTTTVFIAGLSPGTQFKVTVAAENAGGLGSPLFVVVSTEDNVCPVDSYGLPTDTNCIPCPDNSGSLEGSTSITGCVCLPGYMGENGGPCDTCPMDSYGLNCIPCPDDSGSLEGTANITGCVCLPGYTGEDGGPCGTCPVGTFKAIVGNFPCLSCSPVLSTSANASTACDICRFTNGDPLIGEICYPFATTIELETPQDSSIQSTSISLSWQPQNIVFSSDGEDIGTVTGYRLWCTATRGLTPLEHGRALDIPGAMSTTADFMNLQPLVEYIFNITIMAQSNPPNSNTLLGPPGAEIAVITRSNEDSDSSLPQITTITFDTSSNISTVSYTMSPDIVELITRFRLQFVNLDSGDTVTTPHQTPAATGQITVLNIDPLSPYQFILRTTIGAFKYNTEKNMSFQGAPINAPSDVTLSAVNGTFVTVTWTVLDGVSGYEIVVNPVSPGGTPTTVKVIGGSVNSHGIAGLSPFSTYTIQVAGVGVDGSTGSFSDPSSITTLEEPPGPPTNVEVVIIDDSLIDVRWSPPHMPNGVITGYIIVITPDDGAPSTVSVNPDQESIMLSRPAGSFSVTVLAANSAGQGTIQEADLVDQSGGSGFSQTLIIIIIAASAGGGVLLIVLITICCCCCVCHRKAKTGSAGFFKQNTYTYETAQWGDEEATTHVPGTKVSRDNELSRYKKLPGEYEMASPVPLPIGQILPHSVQFVETNINAPTEDMYMEVNEKLRSHSADHDNLSKRQLPTRPIDNKPPSYLEVVREATPADYNNEELYQSVQEIYFADVDQSKTLEAFEVDRSKIELQGQIGQGEFGRVVKGVAIGIVPGTPLSTVAVKMLKEGATDSTRKDFLGEAQMLAHFKHPNVMGLVGVSTVLQPVLVIIPYMPNGDLKSYLKLKQKELHNRSEKEVRQFGLAEQLEICAQIATGMEYLASKFFIHRDLAARNVLVGEENNVKISDFGLSRALAKEATYYRLSQCMRLPVKWMALESIEYRKFSTYSDIWSFGVVLWEVFSYGAPPYKGIAATAITDHLLAGNRLSCPENCPQEVYDLMRRCWSATKEERSTFTQLKVDLKHIASSKIEISTEEDAYY